MSRKQDRKQYGIKLDVARLAKHKLSKKNVGDDEKSMESKLGSVGKIPALEL